VKEKGKGNGARGEGGGGEGGIVEKGKEDEMGRRGGGRVRSFYRSREL